MKRMLRILLLAVLMVPIGAKVNAQCSGTMCSVSIQMMDEYGDGWYDDDGIPFYVKVYQGTTLRGQATLGAGASGTQTIDVCSGDSVRFVFDGEDYYEESSFTILNGDGTTIIANAACSDYTSGQTITTAEVVCPSCIAPFNLSVDASDAENVVVSWIGSASGYEVVVLPATAAFDSSVAVSVTDTVVALDTLTSGTAYSVWVRTDCGSEYSTWAGPVSFAPGLYTMTANSSDTLHACGITIVDDGGLGGDYAPNQNTTLYLYPSDATQMLVLSGSSHSESTYDYVTIYSGIGTSGEVLFTDNGIDVLTTIDTIYSESPVTIVFISDYSNQYDGFQINVSCIDAPDCRRVENFACVDSMTTAHTATFTWQSDASSFQIEYKKAEDTTWTEETTNDTAYTLTGLDATTTYNVRVKALCGSDESLYSAVLNVTTTVACPAPTGLRAVLTPGDGTVATLTWSDPTGSAWQICLNGDTNNYIDVTDTAYEMTDLTPEQAITAKVRRDCSEEEEGYSEWTATITFTPTDAYSITVNDGTTTNEYVPVYGWMADNGIKSQFVIPAADLSAIQWGSVTKLTFYASDASASLGSDVFKVYLTETNATGVSSLSPVSDMEEVYSGSLGVSGNKMEITFATPYLYMGGNLLVAFEEPTAGNYARIYWYGVNATGASMGGYENSYGSYIEQRDFLPKMTIDYTPGVEPTCMPVSGLTATGISGDEATLSWVGNASSYNVYAVSAADTTLVQNVTDTTITLTGLNPVSSYTYAVAAVCGSDESMMRYVTFNTACGTVTSFPFVEGFSTMPDCWTLVDADGDGYNWSILSGYSAIQSASYQSVALTPDNWLITPRLAIPATGSYEVTWTATAQDQNWPAEHYGLFVSTTDNNTSSFTMLQEWTLSTGVFNPVVDLSAYAGQDIYLALRHFNCTDMFRISIDDFTVRAQAGANEVVIIVQQNNPAYGAVQGAGTYTIGDTVTVSATPAANYVFSRWVDEDNVTVSTDNPYTFVAATDLTLKAIFLGANAETYTVTVEVNDTTMGTATGSGTYAAGDMATLSATAYSGYRFVNWTHTSDFGVTVFSTDSIVTITVTGDRVYTANFEADSATQPTQYTVTLSSASATMGTVSPAGATTVDEGASFSATATANDGYHFVSWTDANGGTVSTANPYTFTVTADVALTATFEANSTPTYYTVTVSSADATMGTVSCTPSGSVEAGTSVTATATPANNHIFTGWVDANGDTVSRANPYTFTVTADVTLVGTFRYDGVGIDEAEVSNVSLFPNPATSTFTVSATGMKEATVIDLNGRTVMTQSAADGTATFDVSTLAKGTYFVRIVGEQATAVRKLVVK